MRMLMVLLTIVVCSSVIAQPERGKFFVIDEMAFEETTSGQHTMLWCWAASIEMVLKTQGVYWEQEDIVVATKGYLAFATATAQEIDAFLNNWGFDYNGQPWRTRSIHYQGAMPFSRLVREIDEGRPVITTYQTAPLSGHAVVVYAVNTTAQKKIHSIYYFDPYDGEKKVLSPYDFQNRVSNSWAVDVSKSK